MKSKQINEQEKVHDVLKGIDAIIELDQRCKDDFKRFFRLDLEKMENELIKIGRGSIIMVTNEETNSFTFVDLFVMIEQLLGTNGTIQRNFLNRVFEDEKDKKKYTQFLIHHIIDKIKINIEDLIERRLKL